MRRLLKIAMASVVLYIACISRPSHWVALPATSLPTSPYLTAPPESYREPGCADIIANPGRDIAFHRLMPEWTNRGWWSDAQFFEGRAYLLRHSADVLLIAEYLRPPAVDVLYGLDFDHTSYVIAFGGVHGNMCPGVAIERLRVVNGMLLVCTMNWDAPDDCDCDLALHNPVDLVAIDGVESLYDNHAIFCCSRLVYPPSPPLAPPDE